MLIKILLVSVLAGLTLLVAACGPYGHWNGPGQHHASQSSHGSHGGHGDYAPSHYRGCGH